MKATRILLLVVLGLAVGAAAGCKETYTLHFTNVTNEIQNVRILDDMGYPDVDGLAVAAQGGKARCTVKTDPGDNRQYTIQAGTQSTKFVIDKRCPNPMFFSISPNGIMGPANQDARRSEKWDDTTTIRLPPKEKVE